MKTLILATLLCALTVHVSAQTPLTVYVTSVGAANGRTDPSKDNQDTVNDLKGALAKKKGLTVTDSPESAVIVLRVMNRETERHVSTGKLGSVLGGRNTDHGVTIRVALEYDGTASEVSTSVTGSEGFGVWKRAAGKLADQVDQWVKANGVKAP